MVRLAAASAFLTLAWAGYAWPWLSGAVTIPWDAKNHFYPMLRFLAASVASGQSPDWSPYHFAGHPMIADPQSLVFTLPYRLLAATVAVPTFQHQDAVELGTLLLGAFGLLLFFRERGWSTAGGVVAALVFMFGGPASARLQHLGQILSYAAIPLALWAAERLLRRASLSSGLLLGATGAFLAVGRDQVALLGCYLVAAYLLAGLLAPGDRLARIARLALPIGIGAALAAALLAIPLGLTIAFAAMSNRPEISFFNAALGSLHPAALFTMLVPDLYDARGFWENYWGPGSPGWRTDWLWLDRALVELYAGTFPLVLLIAVGLCGGRAFSRESRFFLAALIVLLLYALGWFTPAFGLFYEFVPGVDLFRRPADASFLLTLIFGILAGHALHRILAVPPPSLGILPVFSSMTVFGVLYLAAGLLARSAGKLETALWSTLARGALLVLLSHALLLLIARTNRARRMAALAALVFTAADVGVLNTASGLNSEPPSFYAEIDPRVPNPVVEFLQARMSAEKSPARRDRVEILGLTGPWQNAPTAWGIEATLGYNPVRWGAYKEATGAGDNSHFAARPFAPLFPSYDAPLPNLLGVRYIVAPLPIEQLDRQLRPGDFPQIAQIGKARIFENPEALPRVLFTESWVEADFDRMIRTGLWPPVDPLRTVVLEVPPSQAAPPAVPASMPHVAIIGYRNTEVTVEVETGRPGFLVLNDLWNPWWRAELNGAPVSLLRANVLFRAVPVPSGRHVVRFVFEPIKGLLRTIGRTLH